MIIREFLIDLYGPVRNRRRLAPGFNLLCGDNETGKTLTVDALVKLLLGRQAREKVCRPGAGGAVPGRIVILEPKPGKRSSSRKAAISKVAGLSPPNAPIFSLSATATWLSRGKGVLRGLNRSPDRLRTAGIAAIIDKLYEMAALTPTGQFRNSGEVKLKSRLEEAGACEPH